MAIFPIIDDSRPREMLQMKGRYDPRASRPASASGQVAELTDHYEHAARIPQPIRFGFLRLG